jgi:hypothetical protein
MDRRLCAAAAKLEVISFSVLALRIDPAGRGGLGRRGRQAREALSPFAATPPVNWNPLPVVFGGDGLMPYEGCL